VRASNRLCAVSTCRATVGALSRTTLAKLEDPSVPKVQEWLAAHALFKAGPFAVDRFALYSSVRAGASRAYEREAEFLLRA
jgi:2'-5' RNA ligase